MEFTRRNEAEILHYIMTFEGGFLGLYAICAFGTYSSAQTGNLMQMVIALVGNDPQTFMFRAIAFAVFCGGIAASWLLTRLTKLPMRALCLAVDAVGLAAAAVLRLDHLAIRKNAA